jgi:hypothetical protein
MHLIIIPHINLGKPKNMREGEHRMEEIMWVIKELMRLIRQITDEDRDEKGGMAKIEARIEEIKREIGEWFIADGQIHLAS